MDHQDNQEEEQEETKDNKTDLPDSQETGFGWWWHKAPKNKLHKSHV